MAEQLHLVDPESCKGDGICVEVCPEQVLQIVDDRAATVEGHEDDCILCGQCERYCPTGALSMEEE